MAIVLHRLIYICMYYMYRNRVAQSGPKGQENRTKRKSGPFIFRVIMTELPLTVLPTTLGSGDLQAGLSALRLLTCGDEVIPNLIWFLPCD